MRKKTYFKAILFFKKGQLNLAKLDINQKKA